MGIKVMRWPLRGTSKKYHVSILVHKMEGLIVSDTYDDARLFVNVKWKGPRGALSSRFTTKKSSSRPMLLGLDGAVEWEEDFDDVCTFSPTKDGGFQAWHVSFSVYKAVSNALRTKPFIVGSVRIDLGELAINAREHCGLHMYPITCSIDGVEIEATLSMSFNFVENRALFDGLESVHKLMAPAIACMGEPMWDSDNQETTVMRKKGPSFKGFTLRSPKKSALDVEVATDDGKLSPDLSEGKFSPRSDRSLPDSDQQFDSDSIEESEVEEFVEPGEEGILQKSFSYGTLAGANLVAEEVIPFHRNRSDTFEGNMHNVHSRASSGAFPKTPADEPTSIETEPLPNSLRSMLSWRKRKLSFRSPKSLKGEPLLNKNYGDIGGDEIDFDRRVSHAVSSDEKLVCLKHERGEGLSATSSNVTDFLDFGDELFSVGSWEKKDLLSRDGQIKLSANVFFASFDQRSESAAGESACTALVAVIADWLHTHPALMPSKAEFDMLLRDGSAEWRQLCDVEAYKGRFPDRHFDLETVLEAGVRPLSVCPEKSFIGFFLPDRIDELGGSFDFLKHAMTFDGIWDEIERSGPAVYIVSWNDHFFVLKVEDHCCYIIDTLGERLYEGCNQAYILHFDETAVLCNKPVKPTKDSKVVTASAAGLEGVVSGEKSEQVRAADAEVGALSEAREVPAGVVYCGKSACRQFVKRFFAAIQLREVEGEGKKGAGGKFTQTSIYQKLQIEFHYAYARGAIFCQPKP